MAQLSALQKQQQQRRPSTRAQSKKRIMEEIMNSVFESIEEEIDCPICFESCVEMGMSVPPCGHFLCKTCAKSIKICPLCRYRFTLDQYYPVYL